MEAQFYELLSLLNADPFDIRTDGTHKSVHRPFVNQCRVEVTNKHYEMLYVRRRTMEDTFYENYYITKYKNKGKWTMKELTFLRTHSFQILEHTGDYTGFATKEHWDNE